MFHAMDARPLIFGEVLFDLFEGGQSIIGGAPFNVAWHLKGFGMDPLLITRVGSDRHGARVKKFMEMLEMDTSGIQKDHTYSTGRSRVSTRNGGHPKYHILPDRAFDYIDGGTVEKLVKGKAWSVLYHGTLSSRRKKSRCVLESLKKHNFDCVFLGLNLRPPWYSDDVIRNSFSSVNWCKLSEHELQKISGRRVHTEAQCITVAQKIIEKYNLDGLAITRGAEGGLCVTADDEQIRNDAEYLEKVVDTVGAGDAFSAVLILGICKKWDLQTTLRRAVRFSADFCGWAGAVTHSLSLHQTYMDIWSAERV